MPCNFFLVEDMMSQTFGDEAVRYMGLDEVSVFSVSALLGCDLPLCVSALPLISQGDRMVGVGWSWCSSPPHRQLGSDELRQVRLWLTSFP